MAHSSLLALNFWQVNLTSRTQSLLGLDSNFSDMTPKAQIIKARIEKQSYIKQESCCIAKQTIDRVKRQSKGQEKKMSTMYMIRG